MNAARFCVSAYMNKLALYDLDAITRWPADDSPDGMESAHPRFVVECLQWTLHASQDFIVITTLVDCPRRIVAYLYRLSSSWEGDPYQDCSARRHGD